MHYKNICHQLFLWFIIAGERYSLLKFVAGELGLLGVESRVSEKQLSASESQPEQAEEREEGDGEE